VARRYVEKVVQPISSLPKTGRVDAYQNIPRESNKEFTTLDVQKETGRQERDAELSRLREQKQESRTVRQSEVKPQEHLKQTAEMGQIDDDRLNREQMSIFEHAKSTLFQSKVSFFERRVLCTF
jgi:hypothetical protein